MQQSGEQSKVRW